MFKVGIPIYSNGNKTSINTTYLDYIIAAGMVPIPILAREALDQKIKLCDGLLLPGGIDIDPTYYGQNNIGSFAVDPKRDIFERLLLHSFIQACKPVFGICRGYQLIVREIVLPKCKNYMFYQNIDGHNQASRHIDRDIRYHDVVFSPVSLYGAEGKHTVMSRMFVNSLHHQAFIAGLKANINSGVINNDDYTIELAAYTKYNIPNNQILAIIEGIRIPELKVMGVQWHPEELRDVELLQHAFNNRRNNEGQVSRTL